MFGSESHLYQPAAHNPLFFLDFERYCAIIQHVPWYGDGMMCTVKGIQVMDLMVSAQCRVDLKHNEQYKTKSVLNVQGGGSPWRARKPIALGWEDVEIWINPPEWELQLTPPRWEFAMQDGSPSPIQKVPKNISVHHPVGRAGMRQDIHSGNPGYFELEDVTDDRLLLDVNRLLDGGFPFLHISDRGKIPLVDRVIVDVRDAGYVNPVATLGVILVCEALDDIFGGKVKLLLPEDDRNTDYAGFPFSVCLRSADFLAVMGDIVAAGHPAISSDSHIAFVKKITSEVDIRRIIEALSELEAFWSNRYNLDLVSVVSELCQNVLYHSNPGGDSHGYLAMQADHGVLLLAVADLGVGIPASLRNNVECGEMNDIQILRKACEAGISSKGDHRGLGLSRVLEVTKKARGYLNICCGNASLLYGNDTNCEGRRREHYADADIHERSDFFYGTQVGLLVTPGDNGKGK